MPILRFGCRKPILHATCLFPVPISQTNLFFKRGEEAISKTFDESTENQQGEAFVKELLWIHGIIRDNLQTISTIVAQLNGGAEAASIRVQINALAATSAIWTLRENCFRYCRFVHGHHHTEDVALFPSLRCFHSALSSVLDRLEADHVVVSEYLDQVEAAANRLDSDESARIVLADALNSLAAHLLTHLDYEEASISPTLRRMDSSTLFPT